MLGKMIQDFRINIDGLRDFVGLVEPFLKDRHKSIIKSETDNLIPLLFGFEELFKTKEFKKYAKGKKFSELENLFKHKPEIDGKIKDKFGEIKTTYNKEKRTINISINKRNEGFEKAMDQMMKSHYQVDLLYRSALLTLTSTAEWFIYQLFHKYYELYPCQIEHKEQFYSLDDLRDFKTIADAEKYLISFKIDKIMRSGFNEWYESLKNKNIFKLTLEEVNNFKDDLVEIFQRRHLLVHNGGIVNEQYFKHVSKDKRKALKKGNKIILTKEYIENAINIIEMCFLLIAFELWKKLDKKNTSNQFNIINNIAIDTIRDGKYKTAEVLTKFTFKYKGLSEGNNLFSKLNYWQAIKWQGRYDEIKEEVDSEDFSAKDELFKTGYYAICDKEDEFFYSLEESIANKKIEIDEALSWPIFKEMRKDKRFDKVIKKFKDKI